MSVDCESIRGSASARAPRAVSDDYFRLISLRSEEQGDVEVLKPVLEELEVMRLSCALGALSSVSSEDFKLPMLEADELDTEFARFLRHDVFRVTTQQPDESKLEGDDDNGVSNDGSSSRESTTMAQQVAVLSLFGTQSEVKAELARLDCWSPECEAGLHPLDQGIYCVKMAGETPTTVKRAATTLVVFAWLKDLNFEPQHLRGTATYVLRFLTCLSSIVVCCLSDADLAEIKDIVSGMGSGEVDEWNSYSVALCVEKQQNEEDTVRFGSASSKRIDTPPHAQLIKGSYPAVAVLEPDATETRTMKSIERFSSEAGFAHWAVDQASKFRVGLSFNSFFIESTCLTALLEAANAMPKEEVYAVEAKHAQLRMGVEERSQEAARRLVEKEYVNSLIPSPRDLFAFNELFYWEHSSLSFHFGTFLAKLKNNSEAWRRVDKSTEVVLFLPSRLADSMASLYEIFSTWGEEALDAVLLNIVGADAEHFERELDSIRRGDFSSRSSQVHGFTRPDRKSEVEGTIPAFRRRMTQPLEDMRVRWLEAVTMVTQILRDEEQKRFADAESATIIVSLDEERTSVLHKALETLTDRWRSDPDQQLSMRVQVYKGRNNQVHCTVEQQALAPSSHKLHLSKLVVDDVAGTEVQHLGQIPVEQDDTVVAVFTIQVRAFLIVTTGAAGTRVEKVYFPPPDAVEQDAVRTEIRRFRKRTQLCDFRASNTVIAFASPEGVVAMYKLSEAFTTMEPTRSLSLATRTTLASPLESMLLLEDSVVFFDQEGTTQAVNLRTLQPSRTTYGLKRPDEAQWSTTSAPVALADGLVVAGLSLRESSDGSFVAEMAAVSSEDGRVLPVDFKSHPPLTLLTRHGVTVQASGDNLLVLDPVAKLVHVFHVDVTVRSDSFRIRQCDEDGVAFQSRQADEDDSRKHENHWLWAFFHVFEKFPVHEYSASVNSAASASSPEQRPSLSLKITRSLGSGHDSNDSFVAVRPYVRCIMEHLRRLNKPLGSMDLARHLTLVGGDGHHGGLDSVTTQSLVSLLQTLVTFVPIQICRAEDNMLVVLRDGQSQSKYGNADAEPQQLQSADIARSIRFGLLSPLLESWRGRCIVVTSMGKQSTGKSYFLNHLTGSSFATSDTFRTDGVWMTVRVLPGDVMLVVLDFEGLGSFKRKEQEDVFLSVLNAALSMFTIFRMEMRLDEEIDEIFDRFHKGAQLIKNDPRLFRGILCMSVKDVNPNDQIGVVNEVHAKFQTLLASNKEQNFLNNMYGGRVEINCSPPFGTKGYYHALQHTRQRIEKMIQRDASIGFASGKEFLDCLRLLLAKISILDSLDESKQELQLPEVRSKLAGLVRTGCLIPSDYVNITDPVDEHVKDDILVDRDDVDIERMCREFPEMAMKWRELDRVVTFDDIRDRDIDLRVDCSVVSDSDEGLRAVGKTIARLFELFQAKSSTSRSSKPSAAMQASFDVFLSFLVRRRKLRVLAWVKSVLGEQLPYGWQAVESQFIGPFQLLFHRCSHTCVQCQLGCMQPMVHTILITAEHDCGIEHEGHGLLCSDSVSTAFDKRDLRLVKLQIESGASLACVDARENAPLVLSVFKRVIEVVDLLALSTPESLEVPPVESTNDTMRGKRDLIEGCKTVTNRLLLLCDSISQSRTVFFAIARSRHVLMQLERMRQDLDEIERKLADAHDVHVPGATRQQDAPSRARGDGSDNGTKREQAWRELVAIRDAQLAFALQETRNLSDALPDRHEEVEALALMRYALKVVNDEAVASPSNMESQQLSTAARTDTPAVWGEMVAAAYSKLSTYYGVNDSVVLLPKWFVPPYMVTWEQEEVLAGDDSFGSVRCGHLDEESAVEAPTFGSNQVPVVVKILNMHGLGGAQSDRAFFRDVDKWYELSQGAGSDESSPSIYHPHILKLLGACHVSRRAFLVIQKAEHGNLLEYLEEQRRHGSGSALQLMLKMFVDAATSLQYLHAQKLVHGHLTCANIVVTGDGRAKLTDFGFGEVRSAVNATRARPEISLSPGSTSRLQWMAPEFLEQGVATEASDVYALGMCMLEAIVQGPPWGTVDEMKLLENIEAGNLPECTEQSYREAWALSASMCTTEPSKRLPLHSVLFRLQELINEFAKTDNIEDGMVKMPMDDYPEIKGYVERDLYVRNNSALLPSTPEWAGED